MSDHVVVVGSSVGGVRTVQELRRLGFGGDITVVGQEEEKPYDKPPLSKQVLMGTQTEDQILLLGEGGFEALGAQARLGVRATGLDIDSMTVALADGDEVEYDALVIATGVRPRNLSPALNELDSVFTVRELRDARELAARASLGPVAVVGAGFIGAEVAASFRSLGTEVTMTEAMQAPFARALGAQVGGLLSELHQDHGVQLLTDATVQTIERSGDVTLVRLADGRRVEAATVVVGIGATPNTEWLGDSGLKIADGVWVDAGCAVLAQGFGPHAEGVYAIGDVARQVDPVTNKDYRVEHWTNAVEHAHAVARQIVDPTSAPQPLKAPYFWSDQFDLKVQMVGRPAEADAVTMHRFNVSGTEKTVAIYEANGVVAAAVTLGWPRAIAACRHAWEARADVDALVSTLSELADRRRTAAL
ncbi:MAG: Phthalate 3,4-dioxygenase, ferredoxin reductase subunit [Nocardioides sp.]|uniref:NAD(P)/FAD-dependent oxidoreductase n=1 Tax=Nocardioides sp. TaxID=35761 RepID=UPI0026170168|nr:FAD-dependent oxidoreductase [Nocardioides sp.]MCW2835023.1 Phthalate 3,4-dioxygenase, ferredoxin reductase subunit [Nocardioides sp.]